MNKKNCRMLVKSVVRTLLCLSLIICFGSVCYVEDSMARPASRKIRVFTQPNGVTFSARKWGDEWINGEETIEGYSIIQDNATRFWTYAVRGEDGRLTSSSWIVGQDAPPADIQPYLRPSSQILESRMAARSYSQRGSIPSTGTGKVVVQLINFADTTSTYTKASFDTLLFAGSGTYSAQDFYLKSSYGKYALSGGTSGVLDWFKVRESHNYYGTNDADGNDAHVDELVTEAATHADTLINFADYDANNDCAVDTFAIFYQGHGEHESPTGDNDIWPHASAIDFLTQDNCPSGGKMSVKSYVVQNEAKLDGNVIETIGTFVHEYGHALGLTDLYDIDGNSSDPAVKNIASKGLGIWSPMASGADNQQPTGGKSGDRPALLSAWEKWILGWVTPTKVTSQLTNEQIQSAATAADVYQLLAGTPPDVSQTDPDTASSGQYFLVENRYKEGFDVGLPTSGLAIWHIDEMIRPFSGNKINSSECVPTTSNCSTTHYRVSLEQADGLWNLEKPANNGGNSGDAGDLWTSARTAGFTSTSTPNSKLYNSTDANVSVTNISAAGANMTATLSAGTSNSYLLWTK